MLSSATTGQLFRAKQISGPLASFQMRHISVARMLLQRGGRSMNRNEYAKMHDVEDRMWWYTGLHANLMIALEQTRIVLTSPVLDAGCGTGGFLARLGIDRPGVDRIGLDFETIAASLASEKSGASVCVGSIDRLPFAEGAFAAIFSADVLCHQSVDQRAALADFRRCLRPGGALVLNLPAYDWMKSAHDRAVHTARRYTSESAKRILAEAGFTSIATGYWNSILFPLMMLRRKVFATRGEASDVMPYARPMEAIFRKAMRVEQAILKRGIKLPFGGSVLAVGRK
jgi:SAM-dependent methyltransferase